MTDQTSPRDDVVLVEVNGGGATFATANVRDGFQLKAIRRYEAALCPTFTGALQDYADYREIVLNGRSLAISVAGVVRGDAVRVTNGRWFSSQSGLTQILGRAPVVLNNVSAITWATQSLPASALRPIVSFADPGISARRRIAVIWLGEGLGAACLGDSETGTP